MASTDSELTEQAKAELVRRHRERMEAMEAKRERHAELQAALASATTDEERQSLMEEHARSEREIMRHMRKRFSPADFEPLIIVGRGAFGEVRVRAGRASDPRARARARGRLRGDE